MTTFTRDKNIFRDEDILHEDYQPESIMAREEEIHFSPYDAPELEAILDIRVEQACTMERRPKA